MARTAGGDLVFTSSAPPPFGTFAERIASPAAMRFPLPAGAPAEAVAAGVNPGMASWLPLTARQDEAGPLGTVLILGVTGISGYLAAQNARRLGATRVVGAGRNPAGLERAAAAGARTTALTGDRDTDAAALTAASVATQIPAYIKLIADGSVQVPFRTFPLSQAGAAWTASTDSGPRVVLVPD